MPVTLQRIPTLCFLLIILVIFSPRIITAHPAPPQSTLSTVNAQRQENGPILSDSHKRNATRRGPKPKALLERIYKPRGPIKKVYRSHCKG